ncbi:MAG: PEP-CTERM sorting domain-containing protein [PVC group bacterium]|nr:PEP-CTERM sorting domain-containing protein [PVC group bacterium]
MKKLTIILLVFGFIAIPSMQANAQEIFSLVPDKTTVDVGETFNVDVIFNNPQGTPFIELWSWIQFDPQYLTVVDPGEDGSWITSPDTNISDAASHSNFSFSWHIDNKVDNVFGDIDYAESVSTNDPITSSGTFASITFQALEVTNNTSIDFVTDGTPIRNSLVVGADGFTNILDDAFATNITVIPEPTSILLFGFGLLGISLHRRKK